MPRLKARWPYKERDERLVGLTMIALLHNYKANNMDLNQIRTVYWNSSSSDGDNGEYEADESSVNAPVQQEDISQS